MTFIHTKPKKKNRNTLYHIAEKGPDEHSAATSNHTVILGGRWGGFEAL